MSDVAAPERVFIAQPAIDKVDSELGIFDEFRRAEFVYLEDNNTQLAIMIKQLFERAIELGGPEAGMQGMAGALFSSRVMRYALETTQRELPRISYNEYTDRLNRATESLVPKGGGPTDYTGFRADYAGQVPLLDRLDKFRYDYSRLGATATIMLHSDVFAHATEPVLEVAASPLAVTLPIMEPRLA